MLRVVRAELFKSVLTVMRKKLSGVSTPNILTKPWIGYRFDPGS
jgi:hypothetical protein